MDGLGRRSVLIGLGASLTGCVPSGPIAVTQSNVDAAYGKKLKRVVVAISVHSAKLTKEQNLTLLQAGELKQSFDSKWGALGISVDVIDVDGFGDKARAIGDAVARIGAEQWLSLESEWILTQIQAVKAYEELTIAAARSGDRGTALRALLANPLVRDHGVAAPLLDALLEANRQHLPRFFARDAAR